MFAQRIKFQNRSPFYRRGCREDHRRCEEEPGGAHGSQTSGAFSSVEPVSMIA